MITERDKEILKWTEKFKSITIDQCAKLFFPGTRMAYDLARKRLRHLNREGLIKRYRKEPKEQVVYFMDKVLKKHDLKTIDVIVEFNRFNITQLILQNKIQINRHGIYLNYITDATIVIDNKYPIIIEVDYTHYTGDKKVTDLISYLEDKHNIKYIFLIIRPTVDKITIFDLGQKSKLIVADWEFNNSNKLASSLRSLLNI